MDELRAMMMINCSNNPIPQSIITPQPIFPTWKLYNNPFYNHHSNPFSPPKIASSFTLMETELELARAQIAELQAELQYEKKARKRAESVNRRLAKELAEERRGREAIEKICEELARGISFDKAEIMRLKSEIEEERKMLKMAEVFREERVQMKLAEAKFLFEAKLLELESNKKQEQEQEPQDLLTGKFSRLIIGEKTSSFSSCNEHYGGCVSAVHRKSSPEGENHHIKRGIKGSVEFPRVVRAINGSRNRNWETKLECQKALLRILLRQKSAIRSNHLIIS